MQTGTTGTGPKVLSSTFPGNRIHEDVRTYLVGESGGSDTDLGPKSLIDITERQAARP